MTTHPGYLEEAAEQLRKAAGKAGDFVPPETRLRIAEGFTRLAAIERNLLPPDWQPPVLGDERGIVLPRRETG